MKIADYLEETILPMRKRTWGPYGTDDFGEHPDGSVPIWFIREKIDELRFEHRCHLEDKRDDLKFAGLAWILILVASIVLFHCGARDAANVGVVVSFIPIIAWWVVD